MTVEAQELWDKSAAAWIALLERGHFNRTHLLDPVLLRMAGDVAGCLIVDVGCGEGRFCRILSGHGAVTIGIEPTRDLITEATRRHPDGCYVEAGGESLPIASDSVDLVICYLVLIDIDDYQSAIAEMARVLKPGGRILVANLNSFCTTTPQAWVRDEDGKSLFVAVDNYFDVKPNIVAWSGIEIVNYHRPFQDYMLAFLSNGLHLTDFKEPRPSEEELREHPGSADAARVPYFHVMQWRKD
jgi:SAM-dependent methyltransferase